MQAMIFAAGLGTRLGEFTKDTPKALVKLNGKPLIQHQIEKLIHAGVQHIVVNVHHFADDIISFIESKNFDATIVISDEREMLLETGGGLLNAQKLFLPEQPILIHNVDIFSDIDLNELLNYHKANNNIATLVVAKRDTSRYLLFNENNRLTGWCNESTGQFRWCNKEVENYSKLAFAGVHIVNSEIFKHFTLSGKFSIIDEYLNLGADHNILAYMFRGKSWIDVGKPDQLQKAARMFR